MTGRITSQMDIFGNPQEGPPDSPAFPPGFRYRPDLIGPDTEAALLAEFATLPFREFEFHGYTGKRRVVSFGRHFDFSTQRLVGAHDIPGFLLPLRDDAAAFAELPAESLQHVLVTEYAAGAGIGWHRDKAVFDEVIGVSLLAPCTFRLRREVDGRWERVNLVAQPRSAYLLSGLSRTLWEHSIPPVNALRYSVTFRNLRER